MAKKLTVDCKHKTASRMIAEAYDFIEARAGHEFKSLDDYFENEEA